MKIFNIAGRLVNHLLPKVHFLDLLLTRLRYAYVYRRFPNFIEPNRFSELLALQRISFTDKGLQTFTSDKDLAKHYVRSCLQVAGFDPENHIIPTITILHSLTDARLSGTFSNCIIKTTHNSGIAFVFRDERKLSDQEMQLLRRRFGQNYFYVEREYNYLGLTPKIIIEKLLSDKSGNLPSDYKIFCCDGSPFLVQVDLDRFSCHQRQMFTLSWERLDVVFDKQPGEVEVPKPRNLELMLSLARCLSSNFHFVRIDLFTIEDNVYVGEITHVPWGGLQKMEPDVMDLYIYQLAVNASKNRKSDSTP